jgi:hypothetical protein
MTAWIIPIIAALIILLGLGLALYFGLAVQKRTIPLNERLVISRFGRFHRVGGPGTTRIYPGLDRVTDVIRVYDQAIEVTMPNAPVYGVPHELTVALWGKFDPVQASRGHYSNLERLLQMSEDERLAQAKAKIEEAVTRQIAYLEEKIPLPTEAADGRPVLALAPGGPIYEKLIKAVNYYLLDTLPTVGVLPDTSKPIVLRGRAMSNGQHSAQSDLPLNHQAHYWLSQRDLAVLKSVV